MADTRAQLVVEEWVRTIWLPARFDQCFEPKNLQLKSGGTFWFDAVSADHQIVANISTSSGITSGGKNPSGKVQKLRADMLFLLMVPAKTRLIVLTQEDMYELCLREKERGRIPVEIKFVYAQLPEDLAVKLAIAREIASREVSPLKPKDG